MSNEVTVAGIVIVVIACIILILGGMFGIPLYNVWRAGQEGKAELWRAEQNKQIKIEEAKAELESAKFKMEAEIVRAEGVAKANEIIGESLKNNEGYLRYLWINNLTDAGASKQVIYVPTEAGLPILEAGRLNQSTGGTPNE